MTSYTCNTNGIIIILCETHCNTHLSLTSLIPAIKIVSYMLVPGHTYLGNGLCHRDSDFTITYKAIYALLWCTNISISEICAEWSVFTNTVTCKPIMSVAYGCGIMFRHAISPKSLKISLHVQLVYVRMHGAIELFCRRCRQDWPSGVY